MVASARTILFSDVEGSTALGAALQAQVEIEAVEWPHELRLRVRVGLHLGEVAEHDGGLVGLTIHRAARVAATAHGGQIIVSDAVREHARFLPPETASGRWGHTGCAMSARRLRTSARGFAGHRR